MATPFLGQLAMFGFNFAPRGWALCDGQTLPINQNQALFALLGTTYGGNGTTTFQLPNLQSRVPVHVGTGFVQGQASGEEFHTLSAQETPAHLHLVNGLTANGTSPTPAGNLLAADTNDIYASTLGASPVALAGATLTNAGGSQPHENRQPHLVINICIALQGIFPSRN